MPSLVTNMLVAVLVDYELLPGCSKAVTVTDVRLMHTSGATSIVDTLSRSALDRLFDECLDAQIRQEEARDATPGPPETSNADR